MSGGEFAVVEEETIVAFDAGSQSYELTLIQQGRGTEPESSMRRTDTVSVVDLKMTESQLLLIVALAEPSLRDRGLSFTIPQSKEAAARLGWPLTQFNGKLENVCDKLTKYGVTGLRADASTAAHDRKRRLVEFAVTNGLVDESHLSLLDEV